MEAITAISSVWHGTSQARRDMVECYMVEALRSTTVGIFVD